MSARLHHLGPPHVHDRWNEALAPALEIDSGDTVVFDCLDSSGQMHPDATLAEFQALDRSRIHTITGPVYLRDAEPGDVLEIEVHSVVHKRWGWSSFFPGLGALPDRFPGPYLLIWKLEESFTHSIPGVTLPLAPFMGIMGVCPGGLGERRTRPPGPAGGNLDVRDLTAGCRLYLPIAHRGALFSTGDGHAAQGNGEVCINGIEAPMTAEMTLTVHKGKALAQPFAELPPAVKPPFPDLGSWAFIASDPDPLAAARDVINKAVDFVADAFGTPPELGYILCSVALDLRISQLVNQPMVTVTGVLPKNLFVG
jgi:acetamidase/formamidase